MKIGFNPSGMFVKARNLYMYVASNILAERKKHKSYTVLPNSLYISNKRIKSKDDIVIPKMA